MIYLIVILLIFNIFYGIREKLITKYHARALDKIFELDDWRRKNDYYKEHFKYNFIMIFDIRKWSYEDFFGDMDKW